jgi:hypothetical protein
VLPDVQPSFLKEEQSRVIASRQLLSFLTVPSEPTTEQEKRAPSKRLFSLGGIPQDAFTNKPGLLNWKSRPIYDVDGELLFWDQTLPLTSGNEFHVRIAGSDLLRTPVWNIGAGPTMDVDGLISKALLFIQATGDLKPLIVEGETTVRLTCYGYPRLGILCSSQAELSAQFVVDLWDWTKIRVEPKALNPPESVITVWSPYDLVNRSTLADFRSRWERDIELLPLLPPTIDGFSNAVRMAQTSIIEERTTNPELVKTGQETGYYCAAATAQMILEQHGFTELTQIEIANLMLTNPTNGATPLNQERAIRPLTDSRLKGVLDQTASVLEAKREIRANRPFKIGLASHARACGGFKTETGGREWLYLYDPLPTRKGRVYYEPWQSSRPIDFMYVQSILYS